MWSCCKDTGQTDDVSKKNFHNFWLKKKRYVPTHTEKALDLRYNLDPFLDLRPFKMQIREVREFSTKFPRNFTSHIWWFLTGSFTASLSSRFHRGNIFFFSYKRFLNRHGRQRKKVIRWPLVGSGTTKIRDVTYFSLVFRSRLQRGSIPGLWSTLVTRHEIRYFWFSFELVTDHERFYGTRTRLLLYFKWVTYANVKLLDFYHLS